MTLSDSNRMTGPMMEKIFNNGDAEDYDKKNKYIELRDHQIRLLGYTSGEFNTISLEKKRKVYNITPLNFKIAIYEIAVV